MESKKCEPSPFSDETTEFVANWLTAGKELGPADLTEEMKEEISNFQQEHKLPGVITLYRGLKSDDVIETDEEGKQYLEFDWLSSWTFNNEMAQNFAEKGVVITKITNDNIFLDTTELHGDYLTFILGGIPDEDEVILKPGRYYVSVVGEEEEY